MDLSGNPIGGTRGTLNALKNIVSALKPDIVYFVLDGKGGSRKKRALYKDYKDGRKPVAGRFFEFGSPQEAKENRNYQTSCLKRFLGTLPVCLIESEDCEADDVIGYISSNGEYFGHRSNIIVSCDKDYYQLIGDKTVVYNPQSKKIIDTEFMLKEHGVHPKHWLFVKAINGDSSDNVKGVKGFGPKTIAKLFAVNDPEAQLDVDMIISAYKFSDGDDDRLALKYQKLNENIDIIKQNWKLMSLQNPLISFTQKDWITKVVESFSPALLQKSFAIMVRDSGIPFDFQFLEPFKRLL